MEGVDVIEAVHETALRWVGRLGLLAALLGALIAARSAAGSWLVFARALNGVPFGLSDPIFHHDLSFYVFRLPAWEYAYGFLFASLIVALIVSVAAHFAVGGIEVRQRESPRPQIAPEQWARLPPQARAADQLSRVGGFRIEEGAPSTSRHSWRPCSSSAASAICSGRGTCSTRGRASCSGSGTRTSMCVCP